MTRERKSYSSQRAPSNGGADWRRLARAARELRERMFSAGTPIEKHAAGTVPKVVNYLSMEFLLGRSLRNAALNLDMEEDLRARLNAEGCALEELAALEPDAALGNGGLGRLAACFMDSCATLNVPAIGYGIRYRYGMFRQAIADGCQAEEPDDWLADGALWEREAREDRRLVRFGGDDYRHSRGSHLQAQGNPDRASGNPPTESVIPLETVAAIPCDIPIPGYRNGVTNILRLWRAEAVNGFNLARFNQGEHLEAMADCAKAERLSAVLYPDDTTEAGRELRLRQQYFLASATLQDVIARWTARASAAPSDDRPSSQQRPDFTQFSAANVFQLNDTHPVIAIPELMRLLLDEHHLDWDAAWAAATSSMAFTNHTLLPEALEAWPLALIDRLLPRIASIIREINRRWLAELEASGIKDAERLERMAIISTDAEPQVRMAALAVAGSFSVNGVAALHTELLKTGLFKDFHQYRPRQFNNKTNGVTPRRWLAFCNPGLASLITEAIGDGWQKDLERLQELAPLADDREFLQRWLAVKRANKERLAAMVEKETGARFDPAMLFDAQVKRIHEYKRQLLNLLHLAHLYERIRRGDTEGMAPRCALIGGKAAPGYAFAKKIIRLANDIAGKVNADPAAAPWLRVAFLPDFRVSSMEVIAPGTDLSQQISTAGKEASGTGNMKFMLNGAVTLGTADGANIEIRAAAGKENFFLFGHTAKEAAELREHYAPECYLESNPELADALSLIESAHFNPAAPEHGRELAAALKSPADPWLSLADFPSYAAAHRAAAAAHSAPEQWAKMSLRNTAAAPPFSSDRTIAQYRDEIWFRS